MEREVIRYANLGDTDAVVALVASAGLPVDGVGEPAGVFFVAVRGLQIVGCCGLEFYGRDALLRSVAVANDERGRGTGARLIGRAVVEASERGLATVSLLTTTASGYFSRFGFREVGRDEIPSAVQDCDEFRSVCPSTATCMALQLGDATVSPIER